MKSPHYETPSPGDEVSSRPESETQTLMFAVLEDAINTYTEGLTSTVPAKRVEAFKVEVWAATDDYEWPFSFANVCDAVGLDPGYVRARLEKLRRSLLQDGERSH